MKNDIITKSTDFLPGKPSLDTVSKTNIAQPKAVQSDDDMVNALAPRSAHIIDLKNVDSKPSESPLLLHAEDEQPLTTEPKTANPKAIKKDKSSQVTIQDKVPGLAQAEMPDSELSNQSKSVNELNLVQDVDSTSPHSTVPKKTSKIKWLLGILAIIIAGAIVATAVLYVLTQYLP